MLSNESARPSTPLVLELVLEDSAAAVPPVEELALDVVLVVNDREDVDEVDRLPEAADDIALNALERDDASSLEMATDIDTVVATPFVTLDPGEVAEMAVVGDNEDVREGMGESNLPDILSSVKNPEKDVYGKEVSLGLRAD